MIAVDGHTREPKHLFFIPPKITDEIGKHYENEHTPGLDSFFYFPKFPLENKNKIHNEIQARDGYQDTMMGETYSGIPDVLEPEFNQEMIQERLIQEDVTNRMHGVIEENIQDWITSLIPDEMEEWIQQDNVQGYTSVDNVTTNKENEILVMEHRSANFYDGEGRRYNESASIISI